MIWHWWSKKPTTLKVGKTNEERRERNRRRMYQQQQNARMEYYHRWLVFPKAKRNRSPLLLTTRPRHVCCALKRNGKDLLQCYRTTIVKILKGCSQRFALLEALEDISFSIDNLSANAFQADVIWGRSYKKSWLHWLPKKLIIEKAFHRTVITFRK